jgi:hypothetical protein
MALLHAKRSPAVSRHPARPSACWKNAACQVERRLHACIFSPACSGHTLELIRRCSSPEFECGADVWLPSPARFQPADVCGCLQRAGTVSLLMPLGISIGWHLAGASVSIMHIRPAKVLGEHGVWWRQLSHTFSLASLACRAEPLRNEKGTMSERLDLHQEIFTRSPFPLYVGLQGV